MSKTQIRAAESKPYDFENRCFGFEVRTSG